MFLSQSQAGEGRQSQILSLPAVGGVRRVASKVKVKALLLVREGRHQSTETQRIVISFCIAGQEGGRGAGLPE